MIPRNQGIRIRSRINRAKRSSPDWMSHRRLSRSRPATSSSRSSSTTAVTTEPDAGWVPIHRDADSDRYGLVGGAHRPRRVPGRDVVVPPVPEPVRDGLVVEPPG